MTDRAERLEALMARTTRDPYAFVMTAFPWGEKGTELEGHAGPDVWQAKVLTEIRDRLAANPHMPIREAISSGHGVGKSSLGAWLVFWALATCPDARCIVTANTEPQLRTKTWPEISRWHRLFIAPEWFQVTATSMYSSDPNHERTWRADAIPWSAQRTEAFAGLHNQGKRILVLFDEASSIDDVIWEVAEGALTDAGTEIIWIVAGNPTRNTGRFRECFPGGRFHYRWLTHKVDSRTAKMTNKSELEDQVKAYGEDHDIVRIRIRGEFPRGGSMQFIPSDLVEAAMSLERDVIPTELDPLVLGVDVARFGDDQSVLWLRRGRDARSIPPLKLRGVSTVTLAQHISQWNEMHRPDAIFIDEGGVGGGVVDHCVFLGIPVVGVQFGGKADRMAARTQTGAAAYANKRSEMWGTMRDWIRGGALPDADPELKADLTGVEYGYRMMDGVDSIQLERKQDMKKRGLSSPDMADALALTFAYPVEKRDHTQDIADLAMGRGRGGSMEVNYDPYQAARDAAIGPKSSQPANNGWMPGRQSPWSNR